jgi:sterol desaturase/sphingolipid hydroxylase (fatty acid hydroxylase superfamily)
VSLIVLSIPIFFLLMGIELLVVRLQRRDYYRLADSVNDLSCGMISQLAEVFLKTAVFAGYLYVYQRHRFFTFSETSPAVFGLGYLGVDFLYYWYHRKSHEMGIFWAAHVVHHQSEEYNLAVALRQGALPYSWLFYLPLALVGLPPTVFLTVSSLDTLYQFWIHTRTIGRLGPLEAVLCTPSNHRVHHGRNPKYIDRNYGGTLIVWDRLFGTYKQEDEEPVYGITTPLRSWNPVWANLSYWSSMLAGARRASGPLDKLRFLTKPPGWRPEALGGSEAAPEVDRASHVKFATPLTRRLAAYVLAQFLLVLAGVVVMLNIQAGLPRPWLLGLSALAVFSLVVFGALLEGRRWAKAGELVRLLATAALLALSWVSR